MDSMYHDGALRFYNVYLPASYQPDSQMPLVFNFHGLGSSAGQQAFYSEMNQVADTSNFIVCYPDGIDNAWNSGFGGEVDDIGFTDKMIGQINENYSIDLSRVYSCGMSNGGYMSYANACELSKRFAAVASVTGSMTTDYIPLCMPTRPVPIMQIHGTADDVVPYDGNPFSASVGDVLTFWNSQWNCLDPTATSSPVEDIDTTDGCTANHIVAYCGDEIISELYQVIDGAHTWPGSNFVFDITNQDFHASEVIWNFFNRYTLEPTDPLILGTELKDEIEINLFPNPAADNLYFESEQSINELIVFNSASEEVLRLVNPISGFDISYLEAGMYITQFNTGEQKATRSFIKL